ncbi:MAG: septum formation initiator family protein [Patescibacteria group bacterium]
MKEFFLSKFFLIILIVVLGFIAIGFARAYYKDYEIRQEIKELETKEQELQNNKINSLKMLEYVSSDDYVEDQARLELNLLADGEKVLYLDGPLSEQKTIDYEYLNQDTDKLIIANYKKWWYYIIKHKLN